MNKNLAIVEALLDQNIMFQESLEYVLEHREELDRDVVTLVEILLHNSDTDFDLIVEGFCWLVDFAEMTGEKDEARRDDDEAL